ncbi:MAG: GNAT family N-acetyltransferase [archaeon]
MVIRLAKTKDAKIVRRVLSSLAITRTSRERTGFVEYPLPSEREFSKRIKGNSLFYVYEHEGRVVGFLSAFSDSQLEKLGFSNDIAVKHLLKKPRPFVYLDQTGLLRSYHKRGWGFELLKRFDNDVKRLGFKTLWCATVRKPVRNKPILTVLRRLGWKFVEYLPVEEEKVGIEFFRKEL